MESKFWSFLGVALAIAAFFYGKISTLKLMGLIILMVVICFVMSYVWNRIINSNHKWIDAVYYFFSKNKLPYIVVDKIVHYSILNEKEATYEMVCDLKAKKATPDFCYKGRYHWDQEDDIKVSVFGQGNYRYETAEDLKWSNVDIFPVNKIVHRNDKINCGLNLTNLHISKLNKHSYLSCKMIEKTKHLKLVATIDSQLKPLEEAIFIIQDSLGREIDREMVMFNKTNNSYEKTIVYPRKGRKYILKWDYEK